MAQWFRAQVALPEVKVQLSAATWGLTMVYNYNPRGGPMPSAVLYRHWVYRHGIWCSLHCIPRSQSLALGSRTNYLLFPLMLAACFCVNRSLGHLHVWRKPWLCLDFAVAQSLPHVPAVTTLARISVKTNNGLLHLPPCPGLFQQRPWALAPVFQRLILPRALFKSRPLCQSGSDHIAG